MSEQKTKAEVAELLLKTADSLSGLADSVRALCASLADSPQTEAKEAPAKKKQTIPLERSEAFSRKRAATALRRRSERSFRASERSGSVRSTRRSTKRC